MLLYLFATLIFGVTSGDPAMLGTNVSMDGGYPYPIAPNQHTPNEIREVWLRCHEDKVCQKADAEFAFPNEKMIVWVNVEKEKNYRKLLELLRPLMDSGQIELRPVHHEIQKGVAHINAPPPSFWTNSELIEHFYDPVPWDMRALNQGSPYNRTISAPSVMYEPRISILHWDPRTEATVSSNLFGQRLLMFAQDILNYNSEMLRYAANLPALARVAFDPEETPALSLRALTVCREDAQRLQKYEKKLRYNFSMALPDTSRTRRKTTPIEQTTLTRATAFDFAVFLSREIQDLSDSVYKFMYPEKQTVTLVELRDPSLIQSLERIQRDTAEFLSFIH
jgi:hypothetical protein